VPDVVLPLAALSEKDRADWKFVCDLGVERLGVSLCCKLSKDVDRGGANWPRGRAATA